MRSDLKPGVLAVIVSVPGRPTTTTEVLGRIVELVRRAGHHERVQTIEGKWIISSSSSPSWFVKSKEPLPWKSLSGVTHYCWQRIITDDMLKPINDPDCGVTQDEVLELYDDRVKEYHE